MVGAALLALLFMSPPPASPPRDAKPAADLKGSPVVTGINRFAFDLFRQVRSPSSNVAISPASIAPAAAMVYEGARGETAEEIARAVHLPTDRQAMRRDLQALLARWDGAGEERPYRLVAANSLWGQKGYAFRPEYLRLLADVYRAPLTPVDFHDDPESARRAVNAWVDGKTTHLIPQLLGPDSVQPTTRLVLANAVYFKAEWSEPFMTHGTAPAAFQVAPGKTIQVPTMRQGEQFAYAETDEVQVLEMPYRGGDFAMVVVLPRKADGLDAVEKSLTSDALDGWLAKFERRRVIVHLPKFKANATMDLSRALAGLGMKSAFGPSADFTGIAQGEPL